MKIVNNQPGEVIKQLGFRVHKEIKIRRYIHPPNKKILKPTYLHAFYTLTKKAFTKIFSKSISATYGELPAVQKHNDGDNGNFMAMVIIV